MINYRFFYIPGISCKDVFRIETGFSINFFCQQINYNFDSLFVQQPLNIKSQDSALFVRGLLKIKSI